MLYNIYYIEIIILVNTICGTEMGVSALSSVFHTDSIIESVPSRNVQRWLHKILTFAFYYLNVQISNRS